MALVNLKKNEIQAKIVYYGPGRGGKTTNLEYIYKKTAKKIKSDIVTINTRPLEASCDAISALLPGQCG